MKTSTFIVVAATTMIAAGGAGLMIARSNAVADGRATQCGAPSVTLDLAEGASVVTAAPTTIASCEDGSCRVQGPEQVEVQSDGRTQCVDVEAGMTLALTRRAGGVSVSLQQTLRP